MAFFGATGAGTRGSRRSGTTGRTRVRVVSCAVTLERDGFTAHLSAVTMAEVSAAMARCDDADAIALAVGQPAWAIAWVMGRAAMEEPPTS